MRTCFLPTARSPQTLGDKTVLKAYRLFRCKYVCPKFAVIAVAGLTFMPPVPGRADDSTRECDLAAASPYDVDRPASIPSVPAANIDTRQALLACRVALGIAPNDPRIQFQVGRVFEALKDFGKARSYYEKAANQGYAAAQKLIEAKQQNSKWL